MSLKRAEISAVLPESFSAAFQVTGQSYCKDQPQGPVTFFGGPMASHSQIKACLLFVLSEALMCAVGCRSGELRYRLDCSGGRGSFFLTLLG